MRMAAYPFQTLQGGSIIRNIAFLNTTYSGVSGFFCSQSGAITIENVAITISAGTCSGLVGSMTQNLTIEDTVVVCNGTSYGYMGAYDAAKTLTLINSYVVTTDTDAIKTPTSTEDAIYVSAKATVCSNLEDLLKKSNNLNSFDSYWSLVEGNLCFGGKVVVAKSAS